MRLKVLIIIIFLSTNSFSQWFWQNPLPQGNTLNSVKFVNTISDMLLGGMELFLKQQMAELNGKYRKTPQKIV
jgi:hypothetical protein